MMLQLGDDGVVSSVNEEDLIYVDKNELEQFIESYNELEKENEQLKKQLKSIEDSFEFSYTQSHIEFNKDELNVKDNHTELILKNGELCISIFTPQINKYFKLYYSVTGRKQ